MIARIDIPKSWPSQLSDGLAEMSLSLSERQRALLLDYLGLLVKWNRAFSLTAVRDPAVMVRRQLLDSLSVIPWLERGPVLDVGTGAGLPGIPLAIARPEMNFSLLDSNGKKTRFLQQVVGELSLSNVEVLKSRVESLDRVGQYATIVSRAFSSLVDLVRASEALLAAKGCWLAMKGVDPHSELAALPSGLSSEILPLRVPGEPGARQLVIIRPAP